MKTFAMLQTRTKLDDEALERDGHRCVTCGKSTGLEVHHVKPIKKEHTSEELRQLDCLDNLKTLCRVCHKKEHNYSGCFGYGQERHKLTHEESLQGLETIRQINKTRYYNRWQKQWLPVH